jgi:uncharacterized protein (TIGR03086 family)
MSEVRERYGTVAGDFETTLVGVSPSRWSAPSPCTEWTARDVALHVIDTHRRVRAALGDVAFEEVDSGADVGGAWTSATMAIRGALDDPLLAASKTVEGPFGEQTLESLVGNLLCADTLIHTWDLARATGQDDRLDAAAAEKALEFLLPLDERIRRPGAFAPKFDPPAGADAQARLLAFTGRAG